MSPDGQERFPGRLVLVVGPSGAGKDTLMRLAGGVLANRKDIVFARRVVTRPSGAHEDHDTIGEEAFEAALGAGRFALAWRAHGLGYALPACVIDSLRDGDTVVANVSRAVVGDARRRFARVGVVVVTAPADILVQRVAARGREANAQARVARDAPDLGTLRPDLVIDNVGDPVVNAATLAAFIGAEAFNPCL